MACLVRGLWERGRREHGGQGQALTDRHPRASFLRTMCFVTVTKGAYSCVIHLPNAAVGCFGRTYVRSMQRGKFLGQGSAGWCRGSAGVVPRVALANHSGVPACNCPIRHDRCCAWAG